MDNRDPTSTNREIQTVLIKFKEQFDRKPRVLHIGNIAANAYNNAKLLNELGFDCDVICPNYYHIMGCPEWEDAYIEGDIKNQFKPDWTTVNLNGFKRPRWFVQGPLSLSIKYLMAKHAGQQNKMEAYWHMLESVNGTANLQTYNKIYYCKWFIAGIWERAGRIIYDPGYLIGKLSAYFPVRYRNSKHFLHRLIWNSAKAVKNILFSILHIIIILCHKDTVTGNTLIRIQKDNKKVFGNNNKNINYLTIITLLQNALQLKELFSHYDVIQGYSIDPIYPYLTDISFFALEHGTLRSIPFDGSVTGTLTALAYANAERIFVTNTDCIDNAKRLGSNRVSVIPHPFDERRMENVGNWKKLREELQQELEADYLIFFPTRHDWIEGQGYNDKANDVFIRAFSILAGKYRLGMICCQWGNNVAESKHLLDELGCSQHVKWMEPMCVRNYETMMKACHVTADQFKLGAFGGVTFRGLAAGRPVCTYLNCAEIEAAYGECPPVVNCRTENEIVEGLDVLFRSEAQQQELGDQSIEWIKKYHSGLDTARTQAFYYSKVLNDKMKMEQSTQ